MKHRSLLSLAAFSLILVVLPAVGDVRPDEPPKIKIPEPGVPQIMTMEGRFVRVAYNNEGYAILGYRLANHSVGEEWMLLEVGLTLRDGVPNYDLTREALSIDTPDGRTIALATVKESLSAPTTALENRSKAQNDKINYFPPTARQACRIGFFADGATGAKAWDKVELSSRSGCLGRLYFNVPGGIVHGQYWLNVKLATTVIRVPFRILTDDEFKLLDKNYKDIEKQVEDAFKKKD